jgi:hypothetical protein
MDESSLNSLRFFMGGFGDARHFFASILDLDEQSSLLSPSKLAHLHAHFILNDIKPQAIGKLLIMLSALRKLNDHKEITTDQAAARSAALCFYIYMGNVMPDYLHKELIQIIKDLIDRVENLANDEYFSRFVRIDPNSLGAVKQALQLWLEPMPFSAERMMRRVKKNKQADKESRNLLSELNISDKTKDVAKLLDTMTDQELDQVPMPMLPIPLDLFGGSERDAKKFFMKIMLEMSQKKTDTIEKKTYKYSDVEFTEMHGYLLPPVIVLDDKERSLLPTKKEDCDDKQKLEVASNGNLNDKVQHFKAAKFKYSGVPFR